MPLPESSWFSKVWVTVDRFTKMRYLIPLRQQSIMAELTRLFLSEVWRHHDLLEKINSDRDFRLEGKFWKWLMYLLEIDMRMSTAYCPQCEGQRGWVNLILNNICETIAFINKMIELTIYILRNTHITVTNPYMQPTLSETMSMWDDYLEDQEVGRSLNH